MKNANACTDVYMQINSIVSNTSSVLFGSTALSRLPVSELVHFFGLNLSVCNRSIEGLDPSLASERLSECVFMLNPNKVFLGFGDEFTFTTPRSMDAYIDAYEELISQIAANLNCEIYLLSPISYAYDASLLAVRLKKLASDSGCNYIDISECLSSQRPILGLFRCLSHYMRDSHISFPEAMNIAAMII